MAYNTDEGTSFSDNYLDDSFASVGNSTRSLLSPILNEKLQIRSSTPEKENHTENEGDDEDSYDPEKSKNMVLTSISLRNRSEQSSLFSHNASDTKMSLGYTCSSFDSSLRCQEEGMGKQLSPWEKWLIRKTCQEREEMEKRKIEKWKEKRELMEKKKKEEEKRKAVEEKVEKWNAEKDEKEKQKREKKKEEIEEKRRLEMQKQQEIEEKSAIVYKKWLKEKKVKEQEAKKVKEIEEMKKKEKEVEKRLKSEQAFEEWLQKSKNQPKRDCNSYGYARGVLKSYYDWASYPMPSFINPMPWVQPVTKKNREGRRQRKKELQPVSPPLLFRDYEKRTKKTAA